MFSRLLGKYEDIPIPSEKRAKTDILCCVITSLLALAMFVFALVTYIQMGTPSKTQHPSINWLTSPCHPTSLTHQLITSLPTTITASYGPS